MKMLNMKRFKCVTAAAGLFLCLVLCTVPVFAAPDKDPVSTEAATEAVTEAVTEAATEEAKEPKKETEPETEMSEKTKSENAITPDGNLTMVDDIVSAVNGNKEFFTLYSKNGSCFYMIIDRDYEGEGNVYFLNMVDDSDLYALTGEKPTVSQKAAETKPAETITETPQPDAGEKKLNVKNAVVAGAVLLAIGGVVIIYFVKKKKGSKNQPEEFDMSEYGEDEEDE